MVYSGAWGKLIHEKNLKSKISWHCPFKGWLTYGDSPVDAKLSQNTHHHNNCQLPLAVTNFESHYRNVMLFFIESEDT
jgi:hypothetical protein